MDIDAEVNDIKSKDINRLIKFLSLAEQDLDNGDPISLDKFCGLTG